MPEATSGATSASSPPEVAAVPADGFPDGWVTVSATDGSFAVSGPGPGTIASAENGNWSIDMHQWTGATCVVYLYRTGPESSPLQYTKGRLLAWAAEMDPHDRPIQLELGTAVGWRTQLNYEDGQYPVGAFQVVYSDGWEYSMGCGLPFTHPKRDDQLVLRFLDSFSTG